MELFGQIGYSLTDQRIGVCSLQGKDMFLFPLQIPDPTRLVPSRAIVPFMGGKAATA